MSSKGKPAVAGKPKKMPPHIKAIEDAKSGVGAKPESDSGAGAAGNSTGLEDYETAKAVKANKASLRQEDIDMVKSLDNWG